MSKWLHISGDVILDLLVSSLTIVEKLYLFTRKDRFLRVDLIEINVFHARGSLPEALDFHCLLLHGELSCGKDVMRLLSLRVLEVQAVKDELP